MTQYTFNILEAQKYSIEEHKHKIYDSDRKVPYIMHILFVISIVERFLYLLKEADREPTVIAAWLHDVPEDHGVSYGKIKRMFGECVAEIVYCVTNELGRDADEKAAKTLPKTATNRLSVFVKIADRIANVYFSKLTNNKKMIQRYTDQYKLFKEILHRAGEYDPMWIELESLILDKKEELV